MAKLMALVMAGGRGTRFWPESTSAKPKQYLNLLGGQSSLLEKTLDRFDGLVPPADRYIITVEEQQALAQLCSKDKVSAQGIILEPSGRNTAPCILLAMAKLQAQGAGVDDVVAIVPSDHVIINEGAFRAVMKDAAAVAEQKKSIVTIGISPHFPHTGFGYIHRGEKVADECYRVSRFVEKPNYQTAVSYLQTGEYLWNAGMFVSTISTLLREFSLHAPEMFSHYHQLVAAAENPVQTAAIYQQLAKISIDYAIMEKSSAVLTMPSRFDWNDLGSWDALETVLTKSDDNYFAADLGHYAEEAKDNIVFAPNQFVSLINVQDLIVVSNSKSLLILPKKDAQRVKNVVDFLKGHARGTELL